VILLYVADKLTFPEISKEETSSSSRAGRFLMASVNCWKWRRYFGTCCITRCAT